MAQNITINHAFQTPFCVFSTMETLRFLGGSTSLSSQSRQLSSGGESSVSSWSPFMPRSYLLSPSLKFSNPIILFLIAVLCASFHTLEYFFVSSVQVTATSSLLSRATLLPLQGASGPPTVTRPQTPRLLATVVPHTPPSLPALSTQKNSCHSSVSSRENPRPEVSFRPAVATAAANWAAWPQRWFLSLRLGRQHDIFPPETPNSAGGTNPGVGESQHKICTEDLHDSALSSESLKKGKDVVTAVAKETVEETGSALCALRRSVWTAACRAARQLAPRSPMAKRMTSAVVARLAVQSLLYPIDVVRCRRAQGIPFKEVPVGALYNGCLSMLTLAEMPYCLLCIGVQSQAQKLLNQHAAKLPTFANLFLSALAADSVGCLYKMPFDCAKSLLQRGKAETPFEAASAVLKDGSPKSALRTTFKGFYAQVLRDSTYRVLNGQTMQALRKVLSKAASYHHHRQGQEEVSQCSSSGSSRGRDGGVATVATTREVLSKAKETLGFSHENQTEGSPSSWMHYVFFDGLKRQMISVKNAVKRISPWEKKEEREEEEQETLAEEAELLPPVDKDEKQHSDETAVSRFFSLALNQRNTSHGESTPQRSSTFLTTLAVGLTSGALTTLATSPLEAARRYIIAKTTEAESLEDTDPSAGETEDPMVKTKGTAVRFQGLVGVCRALYELAGEKGIASGWFQNAPTRMLIAGPCNALGALIFENTSRTLNRLFPSHEK
ncbi:mitochondrial carrier superfamily protein [Cystoisospora suis]|uniref:Mitochondrial carrier superfamily protein n=1 Tax=Cystoisospora suis TaxID=483139 RepID=A0A2C6KCK1_9APIC|nr:mitochondrial carrier superfamily protein [Cystoisospora suis]